MAAAGNVYQHDYEDATAEFVWETCNGLFLRCE